jgi:hypothetical protein
MSAVLYSLSKQMQLSQVVSVLEDKIYEIVRAKTEIRIGSPPEYDNTLFDAMLDILAIDGDRSLIETGMTRRKTAYLLQIKEMCKCARFEVATGTFVYYVPDVVKRRRLDMDAVVSYIAKPICQVLIWRRWEVAAASRWTGTMHVAKKLAIGVMLNSVFPEALADLAGGMHVTEASLLKDIAANAKKMLEGKEADGTRVERASRSLRVSKHFNSPKSKWELCVTIKALSVVDDLHWSVLGAKGRECKANLSDLVDPMRSKVAETLDKLRALMDDWNTDPGSWKALEWFGGSMDDVEVMEFAFGAIIFLSCKLFAFTELKMSNLPYRLQWFLCTGVSPSDIKELLDLWDTLRDCCMGPACAKLRRNRFPDGASLLGGGGQEWVLLFELLLRFTSAPVECEHKQLKEEIRSSSSGSMKSTVSYRSVARHLHNGHLAKGGASVALPLRRVKIQTWLISKRMASAIGRYARRLPLRPAR